MVNPCVGWLPMVFNPPAKLCSKQESLTGLQLGGGGVGRETSPMVLIDLPTPAITPIGAHKSLINTA